MSMPNEVCQPSMYNPGLHHVFPHFWAFSQPGPSADNPIPYPYLFGLTAGIRGNGSTTHSSFPTTIWRVPGLYPWMAMFNLSCPFIFMSSNLISKLMTPKFVLSVWNSLLNVRPIDSTAFSTSILDPSWAFKTQHVQKLDFWSHTFQSVLS